MCEERNMLYQFHDLDAETIKKQLKNMCDAQILEISKELIQGKHLTEFEKFFKILEFETIGRLTQNEDFLQVFLKYKLLQGCWLDVIEILKTRKYFSKPVFLNLWDEANYQKYQEACNRKLTPLRKYRVRQKNPPPDSICPSGFRPSRLLPVNAVSLLQKWFNANKDYPYPCKSTKARMARSAGITIKKVTTWFQNARRKHQRQLLQEALTSSNTNLSFTRQPLDTKCSSLQPITPKTTCDVSTQSETVIIINETDTCNDTETIDHREDCVFKPSHLNMDEMMQDIMTEEMQVDPNNHLATNWKCTSICITRDRNESEETSDEIDFVPAKTSQKQGKNVSNRTGNVSSVSSPGSEAQLKLLFDTYNWNKGSSPLGASLAQQVTYKRGKGMNFDWLRDQTRRSHLQKSAAQGYMGSTTNKEDQCSQSNLINTKLLNTTLTDHAEFFTQGSYISENTTNMIAQDMDKGSKVTINQLKDNFICSNPVYSMNPDKHTVNAREIVSNCLKSFSIDGQKCKDQPKDLTSALNVVTNQHSTIAQKGRHLEMGYSWQRANHSQTLSDLEKNHEWKNIEDFMVTNEDFEWKSIDVCSTKTSKCETIVTNQSDIGSNVYYDNDLDALNQFGKSEYDKPSVINKCKAKPKTKFADNSNYKKSGKMHPVPCRRRRGHDQHFKISHKTKKTLKTCIEKEKGHKSFLVCNKCNEVVKDSGIKSVLALQKLCSDIESNVQSPVEHVAKFCFDLDSETERLLGNQESVPFVRPDIDLPLDMRMESRPVDMTKDKEFNDSCINQGHFASRNQTALFEVEQSPMSLEVPGFRDEIQPINMQMTYEIDRYGPINVHVTPDTQPGVSHQIQYNTDQNPCRQLEVFF